MFLLLDNLYCIWYVGVLPTEYSGLYRHVDVPPTGCSVLYRHVDVPPTGYSVLYRHVDVPPIGYSVLYRHVDVPPIGDSVLYLTRECSFSWTLCSVSGTLKFLLLDTLFCIWHVYVPPT